MKKTKICIIIRGGIGVGYKNNGVPVLTKFIENISENFDLTVFLMIKPNDDFITNKYKIKFLNETKKRKIYFTKIQFLNLIRKEHKKEKFDLIHAFWGHPAGTFAVVLKFLLKLPIIISLQGGDSVYIPDINYGLFKNKLRTKFHHYIYSKADILNVLTKYQQTKLKSFGYLKNNMKITMYGSDNQLFVFKNKKFEKPYKFIAVADLNRVKDYKTLLKAFNEIKNRTDANLTILGIDVLNGEIQNFSKELDLNNSVNFEGIVEYKNVNLYFQKADFLLHTSVYDAQAVVISEAHATGTVVCGTRVGLIADLENYSTIAADVGDYKQIAENALSLINNPEKYYELQNNGLEWSKKFDFNWTIKQFESYYNKLISEAKNNTELLSCNRD
ncbi:MAG: glycosyltransferase [Bacteroidales bacterium]|nr:glycosyltransferase [Bacteroidales bacterium]MBN2757931.1 glycosyltransferase [Bacteroidales bacterium]